MNITVIDYGLGNITSVQRAFERCGACVKRTRDPRDIHAAEAVVLPGVGAFRKAMENLDSMGFTSPLKDYLIRRRPYLGICLGLQVLFSGSREHGFTPGLGIFKGKAEKIPPGVKVPHMGWNRVHPVPSGGGDRMFEGIPSGTFFYFDHSYCVSADEDSSAAVTEYGVSFLAAAADKGVWGVQFHPEKSSVAGLRLIENFIRFCDAR